MHMYLTKRVVDRFWLQHFRHIEDVQTRVHYIYQGDGSTENYLSVVLLNWIVGMDE